MVGEELGDRAHAGGGNERADAMNQRRHERHHAGRLVDGLPCDVRPDGDGIDDLARQSRQHGAERAEEKRRDSERSATGELDRYSYLYSTRAELLRRLDRPAEAADAYRSALALVTLAAERDFLARRLAQLGE